MSGKFTKWPKMTLFDAVA